MNIFEKIRNYFGQNGKRFTNYVLIIQLAQLLGVKTEDWAKTIQDKEGFDTYARDLAERIKKTGD